MSAGLTRVAARVILSVLLFSLAAVAVAEDILMLRARQPFEEAMLSLQGAISAQGYQLSRVQRVDIGLSKSGYQTDKYRVVFYGKPEQVRDLSARYPELIPYLPLKIAIFAEGTDTLLVASDPVQLSAAYSNEELDGVFKRWGDDLQAIFAMVRAAE